MSEIPERVRELIRTSGLYQRDFAGQIGLDDSKLSKSLSGARRFSSLDLARIADACGVTVDWLLTGVDPALAVAARTTGGSAGDAVRIAKRYGRLRDDLTDLGYPQPWRPVEISEASGYLDQGKRLAVAALARVAECSTSVTEPDLPALIEDVFGVDVAVAALGSGFDGLAVSSTEVRLILLATAHVPARQRFTLAHELCHLLAGDDQGLHLDNDVFDKSQRKEPSEQRANAFAAEFLMPQDLLRTHIDGGLTTESFAALACELMVTPSTLALRLQSLRYIDAGVAEPWKSITAAKAAALAGRGDDFAHRVAAAARTRPPGLLVRDAFAAYQSGKTTLRPYANLLEIDVDALRLSLEPDGGSSKTGE
ncbi:helix-turn-helix domain-containing protein [Nocardia sp. XZ_19_231]|uniref:helix-turn-helix domain-containing protein n=1 Tax=Nocardia sp. XZ_19_231 TaxID=2769252 RepID=UPI00351C671F